MAKTGTHEDDPVAIANDNPAPDPRQVRILDEVRARVADALGHDGPEARAAPERDGRQEFLGPRGRVTFVPFTL